MQASQGLSRPQGGWWGRGHVAGKGVPVERKKAWGGTVQKFTVTKVGDLGSLREEFGEEKETEEIK